MFLILVIKRVWLICKLEKKKKKLPILRFIINSDRMSISLPCHERRVSCTNYTTSSPPRGELWRLNQRSKDKPSLDPVTSNSSNAKEKCLAKRKKYSRQRSIVSFEKMRLFFSRIVSFPYSPLNSNNLMKKTSKRHLALPWL